MASSCKYDVFLSFRGEDTRDNFTSHLVQALLQKKIKTFIDEQLNRGDEISPALLKAIEDSKIAVIIFSKNFASSKWCLDELVKILECRQMIGQIVIPVFYHVDPSHVRKQEGSFKDAFVKHEKKFKKTPEKVQKWRAVLTEASNLSGWDSMTARPDAKLVRDIIGDILKKLEKISTESYSDGLVGLELRIEEIKSLLAIGVSDFRIIGIWGMGGIGKTTLAGEVFNQFSKEFEGKYFMANVREESEKGGGLVHLRKQILSKILGEKFEIETPRIPQYTRDRLRRMKVFLALDDVSKFGQLEYLAGGLDRFGPGSRIIVTTRDKTILERYGSHEIYEVEGLDKNEALQLFCNFAFREHYCEDLLKLSDRVVCYAKGNPLALKVLGSLFHGKSKPYWKNALDNLKRISGSDIYDILKISYNELCWEEKSLFLDIACFFNGDDRDHVIWILNDRYSVRYELDVLVNKSLITVSDNNKLQLHDLLQEMGRDIVCQESREKPEKRSRLWYHEDVCHVIEKNKGTDAIEGIFLDLSKIRAIHLDSGVFADMSNLRLLNFYISGYCDVWSMSSKVHLQKGLKYLPQELRFLHWHGYPLKTLPPNFVPINLIKLNLPYSKVEKIWEGKKEAFKLRSIDLHDSHNLTRIPEPSETPNLERMNLWNCTSLSHIPSYIQKFNKLGNLGMVGCKSLRCFPRNIHFISPIKIDFSKCENLREFPRISGNVVELKLWRTPIEVVPTSIECLTNLESLNLVGCKRLKKISTSFCKLKSLRSLYLGYCLKLGSFPEILEKMELLEIFDLQGTGIKELPSSIEHLEGLKELRLSSCLKLGSLPESLGNLKCLEFLKAGMSAIRQLPSSIKDLNKLEKLLLFSCRGLVLPSLLSGLSSLEELQLSDCEIIEIPEDIGRLSSLRELKLTENSFESLPTSISQLSQLRRLYMANCAMLQSLPKLPLRLEYLDVSNCKQLQSLPELPSCLEELHTSLLETPGAYTLGMHWSPVQLNFANCLKLNEEANTSFWADLQQRIHHMEIATLTLRPLEGINGSSICLPGSEIPYWFSNHSLGSSITIQLPQRSCSRMLFGFALCVVIESEIKKEFYSCGGDFAVYCGAELVGQFSEISVSFVFFDNKSVVKYYFNSVHVILGLYTCWNFELPDGDQPTAASFDFLLDLSNPKGLKVKCCGASPVYAYHNQARPNTFTLKFAATSEDADTAATTGSVGSSDEDEVESIFRDQFNAPQRHTSLFFQILEHLCCF